MYALRVRRRTVYRKLLSLILGVLLPALSAGPARAGYEVLAGDYASHDPVIIRQGDTYYSFCTGSRIPIRASKDMHDWRSVGTVLADVPSWVRTAVPKYSGSSMWAPDISYFNGRYHLYYSASTFGSNVSAIGLATNVTLDPCDPNYAWVDSGGPVIRSRSADNYNTIDPAVFIDNQGETTRYWLAFGSFWSGIEITEIDPATGYPLSNPPVLYPLAWNGSIEAPFIISRNGYYYLFVSFDSCCRGVQSTYNVRVGRAASVTGPYSDRNGVWMMDAGGTRLTWNDQRWKGPGHQAVFQDHDGRYWLVHHAYDAEHNGRAYLRIHELFWTADGWPTLQQPGPVDVNDTIVARWAMDEGAGDIAVDSSTNGYDGAIIGPTWTADDPNGGAALLFDGINDYIDLPDGFTDFNGLTVSVWAYPNGAGDWAAFVDLGNGDANDNIFFGHSRTSLTLAILNGTDNLGTVTASRAVTLNVWQHFAATVDVCGGAVLYKNGVPIKTGTTSPPWNVTRTDNHVGRSNWSANAWYQGLLADIRIYNRALDANDIHNIYEEGDKSNSR
jgi:arabinan endo-1,5-alpha-L-arabinosidase